MIRFKQWLEATKPLINVVTSKNTELDDFIKASTDFSNYLNKTNLDELKDEDDLNILHDLIYKLEFSLKTYQLNSNFHSNDNSHSEIQVPGNWKKIQEVFTEIKPKIDKVWHFFRQNADKIKPISEKLFSSIQYEINRFLGVYFNVAHMLKAANQQVGNRFTGRNQQAANQISADVKKAVLFFIQREMVLLGKQNKQLQNMIKKVWDLITKEFNKPLKVSALQKEAVDHDTRHYQEFIESLRIFSKFLSTPGIWRDKRYAYKTIFNVISHIENRHKFYKPSQESKIPINLEKTIKAIEPVIKKLPNFARHFANDGNIMYLLNKFNEIWRNLKNAWIKNNKQQKNEQSDVKVIQDLMGKIWQTMSKNLEELFPQAGKNLNNYMKALNLYFNRIKGVLDLIY